MSRLTLRITCYHAKKVPSFKNNTNSMRSWNCFIDNFSSDVECNTLNTNTLNTKVDGNSTYKNFLLEAKCSTKGCLNYQ